MARFLYLNGKRMTKFDLGHLIDSIAPAWSSNAWLMEDVWNYRQFVVRLVDVVSACTDSRIADKVKFYYPNNDNPVVSFWKDIHAYYR